MDLHSLPPPTLVTDARGLERVLDDCARATRIAVDTHDAADVLRKVQDDLDRLDVATFHQQWGIR